MHPPLHQRVGQHTMDVVAGADARLTALGIQLPAPPGPLGIYAMAVQSGSLLFLTGMLPIDGHVATSVGRAGAELDLEAARHGARRAALNALALLRQQLGSLDRVRRIVRLGVFVATSDDFGDHAKVADGASGLLQDVFGAASNPCRLVIGVASLPLGVPVELELIVEVAGT